MRIFVALVVVALLAAKLIHPQFTGQEIIGFCVIVPALTVALYGAFSAFGGK